MSGQHGRRRRRRGHADEERPLEARYSGPSRKVRVLYVACEGESTEPDYLRYLNERFGDGGSEIVVEKLRKADPAFRDYDKKNDKSLRGTRRKALEEREAKAVERARSLVKSCPHGSCVPAQAETETVEHDAAPQSSRQWAARSGHAADCPILQRDPSTDVWRLLVSLGIHPNGRRA